MTELAALERKRVLIDGMLISFQKHLENTISKQELTDLEIAIFKDRLKNTLDILNEFNNVQNEIEMTCTLTSLPEQSDKRESFENKFYELTNRAKLYLKQYELPSSQSSFQSSYKSESVGIKLPDILLPKFNGNFEDWLEFRDTFKGLIHENESLTSIQKFFYLRGALEGNAAASIKKIQNTADNYAIAWNTLCERFNNTKKLLHDHLGALLFFEPIHKGSSDKLQHLADNISRHLGAIEQLGQSVENWDCLLIFWISQKLDNASLFDWERQQRNKTESPEINDFLSFLRERANFVDSLDYKSNPSRDKNSNRSGKECMRSARKETSRVLVSNHYACTFCQGSHSIYKCDKFLNLTILERNQFVQQNPSICANCLRKGHPVSRCRTGPCKRCKSRHNSLLHDDSRREQSNDNEPSKSNVLSSGVLRCSTGQTILSTAQVLISDNFGKWHSVRALLDCGSQTSFITERLRRNMNIFSQPSNLEIYGISNNISSVKTKCNIELKSRVNKFSTNLTCYVLPDITSHIPSIAISSEGLKIPSHIILADPEFHKPGPVDMLIGADLFWQLLDSDKMVLGKRGPYLQETKLGWIVSGPLGIVKPKTASCNLSLNRELLQALTKFWEIEELSNEKILSPDELLCEKVFAETTTRNPDGRFVVNLPLKQEPSVLGESRSQAKLRFLALEKRLLRNERLGTMYRDFMREYINLNHMTIVESPTIDQEYLMPHHGVLKESSLTTKLRVVFDASAPTSNGMSLNNIQAIGPVLQNELFSIILRFRQHRYVISADIAKMYRQVLVNPLQRPLQRILWRDNPSKELCTYELNTVTYGQASASFLAIRCLFALAQGIQDRKPDIARIIMQDFYVDDLLTGTDSLQDAQRICREVSEVLIGGCFELRKWYSNSSEVLQNIIQTDSTRDTLDLSKDDSTKTLGLTWACQKDNLMYNININHEYQVFTKRSILSIVSKIFDPLGLLSPCIILAKILLQELWSIKTSWDDPIPESMRSTWLTFQRELPILNNLSISRHAIIHNCIRVELHGFCDSSERAYGACVYLRSLDKDNNIRVTLLCAKSKVAPIKTVSLPRLELCGALLLSRLTHKIVNSMNLKFDQCFLWSDSTITLAWIKTSPNLLKTFTGNRVSEIQTLTQDCQWKYVPSKENPADIVSRGLLPNEILHCEHWWKGPFWLSCDRSKWPSEQPKANEVPELKSQSYSASKAENTLDFPFHKFSSFNKMRNVTAYMLRFSENCLKTSNNRIKGGLTPDELNRATKRLIKTCQHQCLFSDIQYLLENNGRPSNKLAGLTPFLDAEGILRVGGRLKYSDYDFNKKHPILLPGKHHLTKLIFHQEHVRLLHAGPQLLLSSIRNTYWPISGRTLARDTVRRCIRCFRFRASTIQPIMSDLPHARVMPSSPFSIVGIDYAGPLLIKDRKGRGCKVTKCYLGPFVCFATKAVHLELISSLSSEAFIQALRRFISRRGKPTTIYSDNGTNFVGAQKELQKFLKSAESINHVKKFSIEQSIDWHFIPPYSPHFGGLWEAGVKSSKHHLKRVMSKTPLSFEELSTLLCQVEAILNSRPLSPLSPDPNDLTPLTPAHFLIGRPLIATPDEEVTDVKINRLDRFQLVQQMTQHFWQRWKTEYISELQLRQKWRTTQGALLENALVLLKDDHTLPTQWQLGRIIHLHPGPDGVSRVATIKTSSGVVKRGFQKICPLPLEV